MPLEAYPRNSVILLRLHSDHDQYFVSWSSVGAMMW